MPSQPHNIVLRPAVATDAAPLADLLNEIIAAGGTTAMEVALTPSQVQDWFIAGPEVIASTICEAEEVLGLQCIVRHPLLPGDCGDIATFVRIGHGARGIGTALFGASLAACQGAGLSALNATIRADNAGGLRYYAKIGFRDWSVDRARPLRDGHQVDRISKRFDL